MCAERAQVVRVHLGGDFGGVYLCIMESEVNPGHELNLFCFNPNSYFYLLKNNTASPYQVALKSESSYLWTVMTKHQSQISLDFHSKVEGNQWLPEEECW